MNRRILIVVLSLLLSPREIAAQEGKLCSGYNPTTEGWDLVGVRGFEKHEENCPDGYAYMSMQYVDGAERPGKNIPVLGNCCPLPDNVLTGNHIFVPEQCPAGFVATGAKEAPNAPTGCNAEWRSCLSEWEKVDQYLRCTQIDSRRFQLGANQAAIGTGFDSEWRFWAAPSPGVTRGRIPVGLRYGVSRNGKYGMASDPCLGLPWGSLLVGKEGKRCGFSFAELEYSGAAGDPPRGTPVKMFPDCLALSDIFDPHPKCITKPDLPENRSSEARIP